jgi:glycosyltransferase involved in cell wall biosynthesis
MIPLIVHSHNIEYKRFRQMGKWWWPMLYLLEKFTHSKADLNLFKTPEDLAIAVDQFGLNPARCLLVPYGLEQMPMPDAAQKRRAKDEICNRHGINRNHTLLLFNGTLDYEPNADGVTSIVHKLMPLLPPDVVVLVCGRLHDPSFVYLKDLQAPGFTLVGYVDDIDIYFRAADLFINPVSSGGGVKVKVMEALSYGLPVVSYATGVAGIDDRYTGNLLRVVPDHDAQAMAAKILDNEPAVFDPATFIQHYHWEGITGTVAKRIRELDRE